MLDVPAGGSQTVRAAARGRRCDGADAFSDFDQIVENRLGDADEFYTRITPPSLNEDQRRVHRQALAGMLWSKQFYYFDLEQWLSEHQSHPLARRRPRRACGTPTGSTCSTPTVISMPDKWEYPWYAAWDLAFHTIALALVDFDFAKDQLLLMLRSLYFHPERADPRLRVELQRREPAGARVGHAVPLQDGARPRPRRPAFLERSFQGLMLNFNWWVNRKDPSGRNVFAGGFLGLDNIGVFDRSAELPTGGSLEQADGTAWMAFYCQCMLEMALILCEYDPMYEEVAFKFVQHFMWICLRHGPHRRATTTRCGTSRTASSTTCCGCRTARRRG